MSENKKRNYTHIEALESEVMLMLESGHTQRETAEHFGFKDKYVIKRFMNRHRKKEAMILKGITPHRRGRLPKGYVPTEIDKDNEIKRLKMENELLRDFLRVAGRK